MNAPLIWSQFLVSAALVIVGGCSLARNGKELGKRWGLTEIWVGFIFLAAVTSIPELVTALGAVMIANSSALALGDILGSNAFNLFIIAILNLYSPPRSITAGLSLKPFRILIVLILAMTAVTMTFLGLEAGDKRFGLGGIGLASWLLLFLYLFGTWKLYHDEQRGDKPFPKTEYIPEKKGNHKSDALYLKLLVSVFMVVAGGFWLARTGNEIAELTHWGQSFVGALFLAVVTSLPEVAVCLAAVKIGAFEMALSNILGSNMFNLSIIFWADLARPGGHILAGVDRSVYAAGLLGVILLLIVALALKLKPGRIRALPAWDSISLILAYLAGMYWVFRLSVA